MLKYRVIITDWDGTVTNKYFNNKTSAYNFCKEQKDFCVMEIFHYEEHIWKSVKLYL